MYSYPILEELYSQSDRRNIEGLIDLDNRILKNSPSRPLSLFPWACGQVPPARVRTDVFRHRSKIDCHRPCSWSLSRRKIYHMTAKEIQSPSQVPNACLELQTLPAVPHAMHYKEAPDTVTLTICSWSKNKELLLRIPSSTEIKWRSRAERNNMSCLCENRYSER